ncbi:MAG: tetratricopeptide repeat protein [Saezia sp.]
MRFEFKEHTQVVKKIIELQKTKGVKDSLQFIEDTAKEHKLTPGYVWQLKATLYSKAKMPGKEIICYTKALETDENHVGLYFLRGRAFYKYKLYQKAISDFTDGLIVSEEQLDMYFEKILYFYRAHAYYELGQYDKALEDLDQVPYDYAGWTDDLRSKDELLRFIEKKTSTSNNPEMDAIIDELHKKMS